MLDSFRHCARHRWTQTIPCCELSASIRHSIAAATVRITCPETQSPEAHVDCCVTRCNHARSSPDWSTKIFLILHTQQMLSNKVQNIQSCPTTTTTTINNYMSSDGINHCMNTKSCKNIRTMLVALALNSATKWMRAKKGANFLHNSFICRVHI